MDGGTDKRTKSGSGDGSVGKVWLVGAGPGDAGLMTVRGAAVLGEADVVVYDALVNPELLRWAKAGAELVDAGKRGGGVRKLGQDHINELLARKAEDGKKVVRLKGGDPYVFGRGGEEAIYLGERGVEVEVVSGVTAGIAGAGCAGIPVTHRGVSRSVTLVTGHEEEDAGGAGSGGLNYEAMAGLLRDGGTVVFYMGMSRLGEIMGQLMKRGVNKGTDAVVVEWGTTIRQRVVRSTVGVVESKVEEAGVGAPSVVVVGKTAGLRGEGLRWFEKRKLFGKRVVVTRTREGASGLRRELEEMGATVMEAAMIEVEEIDDWRPVFSELEKMSTSDWVVVTSGNGAKGLGEAMRRMGWDARRLGHAKVAAVGAMTGEALWKEAGVRADLVPATFTGEELVHEMVNRGQVFGRRFMVVSGALMGEGGGGIGSVGELLRERGATDVREAAVYRVRELGVLDEEVRGAMARGEVDWVTFASGSAARSFARALGGEMGLMGGVKVGCIGPRTREAAEAAGFKVTVEAEEHTVKGLARALGDAEQEEME